MLYDPYKCQCASHASAPKNMMLQCSDASVHHLKFAHFGDYKDKIRTSRIIKNGSTRSMVHCAQLCSGIEACVSFFHNKNTRHCSLHDVIFFSPDDGTDSPGMKYYVYNEERCSFSDDFAYSRTTGVCLKISYADMYKNYPNSKKYCEVRNLRLAVIDSQDKYQYTVSTIRQSSRYPANRNYYIGLTDLKNEGQFVWIDGTNATWTNWRFNRPKMDKTRNCVILAGNNYYKSKLKFVDKECKINPFRWICEKVLK
ncbi:uncharacterized protein LOC124279645 [Haliotis rubra]|uniref:uncharacterized protein LOC124279645 n=1 Tax=Haliotis rubra TaxID=36100 RepID=UPI001EE577AA|nr:uncharacterized protein LOC124279645 [Haliotis rubra]